MVKAPHHAWSSPRECDNEGSNAKHLGKWCQLLTADLPLLWAFNRMTCCSYSTLPLTRGLEWCPKQKLKKRRTKCRIICPILAGLRFGWKLHGPTPAGHQVSGYIELSGGARSDKLASGIIIINILFSERTLLGKIHLNHTGFSVINLLPARICIVCGLLTVVKHILQSVCFVLNCAAQDGRNVKLL